VYNIEVEGDHCYRVGEQGLLVHNASAGKTTPPQPGDPDFCGPPHPCDMPIRIAEWSNREFSVPRCEDRETKYTFKVKSFNEACKKCNPGMIGLKALEVEEVDDKPCYENMAVTRSHPFVPGSKAAHILCGKSRRDRANVSVFCCPCCEYQDGQPVVVWYCFCSKTTSS
jgi:hypothetical protein